MSHLYPAVDPDGRLEYSVVYTDRALNHMSEQFQGVMRDLSSLLKELYHAHSVAIIPGSGTFAMEAVARQFANDQKCLVIRNGWFSYRWSQILEMGKVTDKITVLKAQKDLQKAFSPAPIEEVVQTILKEKPALIFAPHVETASGMILPDDYLKALAKAAHEVSALFVLDGVASGATWVNMKEIGIDLLITAPQKGLSAQPGSGLVMMSEVARKKIEETTSTSFACDLKKWLQIMETYEGGAHAYHATMPTEALLRLRDTLLELQKDGFETLARAQSELGGKVRAEFVKRGFQSVAATDFAAASVLVFYTQDDLLHSGKKFTSQGIQSAAGVPLQCDEGADFKTFRIGLLGIEKLRHVDRTVRLLTQALDAMP